MISRILRQIASLGVAELIGRLFTFAFSALVARVAGVEVLGYLSLALALITYVTIAGDSGLNQDSTRRLIKGDSAERIVQESVRIQVLVAGIASVVVIAVAYIAYGDPVFSYVILLIPVPIAMSMSTPYLLDYVRRIKPLVISRLIQTMSVGIIGVLLILIGIRGAGIALAYGAGACLSALFVVLVSKAPYKSVFRKIEPDRLKLRIGALRRLGLTGILLHVFVSLPLAAAGFMTSEILAEMGLISRIWFLAAAPVAMAGTVLLPVMSTVSGRGRIWKLSVVGLSLGLLVATVISFGSNQILSLLFGPEAHIATQGLSIFVYALPPYGVVAVMSAYLVAIHRERAISVAYAICIVVFLVTATFASTLNTPSPLSVAWLTSSVLLGGLLTMVVLQERRRVAVWSAYLLSKSDGLLDVSG